MLPPLRGDPSRGRPALRHPETPLPLRPPAPALPVDPLLSPAPRRARWGRLLLSLFTLWHGLAVVGSVARDTPPGAALRTLTRPYEQVLGVYQTWTMFVPDAPRSSEWLIATGRTPGGVDLALPVLAGDLPPARVEWRYRRGGKLERNAVDRDRGALRRGWAWWACRRAAARGTPLQSVLLERGRRRTPPPAERAASPRAQWTVEVTRLSRQSCEGQR